MKKLPIQSINNENKNQKKEPIVHEFTDRDVALHAFVVIDTLWNGRSCGGLRIADDLTLEELKTLAYAMTLKYCFSQRHPGGAKAGIILPKNCTPEQRTKILEAFGRAASSLLKEKTYVLWTDLNSSIDDIDTIMKSAGCNVHKISDSSYFTALTVVSAIRAACKTKGIDISTVSVTIEGFGAVGMNIASELVKWGVKILGVSTVKGALYDRNGLDINKLIELKKQYQDELVYHYGIECIEQKELLFEMDTDILVPCARTWCINRTNMEKIKAKMIIPGANVPLTKEAEKFLHQKGILCLPDFICNCGGVFGTTLYDNGNNRLTVHRFIMNEFGVLVEDLISESEANNLLPSEIAEAIAEKNWAAIRNKEKQQSWRKKYIIEQFRINIPILNYIPGVQAWISLQNQRRIFAENIQSMKNRSYH